MIRSYLGGTISENLEMIWAYIKGWCKDVWDPACRLCRAWAQQKQKIRHAWFSSFSSYCQKHMKPHTKKLGPVLAPRHRSTQIREEAEAIASAQGVDAQWTAFSKASCKGSRDLKPVSDALLHFADQDPGKRELLTAMVQVLELSRSIDVLIDAVRGYKRTVAQGNKLEELVQEMNEATSRLCRHFLNQGLFFFRFAPKNHHLLHLAQLGKHMSPKLAWCYKGGDLMDKIKTLAQGGFRGNNQETWQQDSGEVLGGSCTRWLLAKSLLMTKEHACGATCKE